MEYLVLLPAKIGPAQLPNLERAKSTKPGCLAHEHDWQELSFATAAN